MAYFISIIAVLCSILVMVFWMFVGWRAMRAHEELSVRVGHIAISILDIKDLTEKLLPK